MDTTMDLARFGLIAFAIVCGICVLTGGIVLGIAYNKDPEQATESVRAFFEGGNALRVATVFAVLGTTTVLTFADKMTEGILALMSGIVGYVLGGLHRAETPRRRTESAPQPPQRDRRSNERA